MSPSASVPNDAMVARRSRVSSSPVTNLFLYPQRWRIDSTNRPKRMIVSLLVLALLLWASAAYAKPATEVQSRLVVQPWLSLDPKPLGAL